MRPEGRQGPRAAGIQVRVAAGTSGGRGTRHKAGFTAEIRASEGIGDGREKDREAKGKIRIRWVIRHKILHEVVSRDADEAVGWRGVHGVRDDSGIDGKDRQAHAREEQQGCFADVGDADDDDGEEPGEDDLRGQRKGPGK